MLAWARACAFSSTIGRPCARGQASGSTRTSWPARSRAGSIPADSLVLFSSSWKDRLTPDVIPGVQVVDARVPVTFLNLAWHRLEWPPVETFAGEVDVVHSMHPLLMPARRRRRS